MKQILLYCILTMSILYAQTIRVGSENAYKPFAYLNHKSEPSGFDNDVVKVVAKYMQNDKIEFVPVGWNSIFSGLDSAKFDIVANQIAKTKDREEKYLFSQYPYFYAVSGLIVGKDSVAKDIKDLKKSKIGVTIGSNHAKNLESFVKENPNLHLQIIYYKTSPALIADLANGRVSAIINDPIAALDYAKAQNVQIQVTDFYFEKVPIYFLFRKDSQELAMKFDNALQKALSNGDIDRLIIAYFGTEYLKFFKEQK